MKKLLVFFKLLFLIGLLAFPFPAAAQDESLRETIVNLLARVAALEAEVERLKTDRASADASAEPAEAEEFSSLNELAVECDFLLPNPPPKSLLETRITKIDVSGEWMRVWFTVTNSGTRTYSWGFVEGSREANSYVVDEQNIRYAFLDTNFPSDNSVPLEPNTSFRYWVGYELPNFTSELLTVVHKDLPVQLRPANWEDAQALKDSGC